MMAVHFESEDFILEGHALVRARSRSKLADDEISDMLEKLRTGNYHLLGIEHGGVISCEVQIRGKRLKVIFAESLDGNPKMITIIPI